MAADPRDVLIESKSGLLNIFPPHQRPLYEPSKRKITFHNGAVCHTYSAEEPDQLRGPEHGFALCDEFAAWKYARETWDNLWYGLRASMTQPRAMIASTPRAIKIVKEVLADAKTVISTGSTYDNRANLPAGYIERILRKYEGTPLAQQEIYGRVIDDQVAALWHRDGISANRVTEFPQLTKLLVAIDPAVSSTAESNDTGIIVGGKGIDDHGYILDDVTMSAAKPEAWAAQGIAAYHKYKADGIVAEKNQGGDMVESTIRAVDPTVPVTLVHASRGKRTRAEPVSAMSAQGRIHHVGLFAELEDQLCHWVPGEGDSPDRLDAMVWLITELFELDRPEKEVESHELLVYNTIQEMLGTDAIGAFPGMT
jgi:phage terminase large subunit-like protein